jgi:hypothetical protein
VRGKHSERISEKNERLPAYRPNLPSGAHVWLLIYVEVTVSRSMPIPHVKLGDRIV